VNDFLQSVSNPAHYAAGDAAEGGPPLTPVAGMEGTMAALNLLEGNRHRPDYSGVPSVVFTVPPLARVGLGEDEARKAGLDVRVKHEQTSGWHSSRRIGETCSGFKTIVNAQTREIVGAHLLGHNADEVINLFALAIRKRLTAADLEHVIYAYPTHCSTIPYML
jgi:glutathione reductase (NADPH)